MALTKLKGFVEPDSLKEVAKLLQCHQGNAMIVGGGTFIHGLVARGLVTEVEYLISLGKLGLDQIEVEGKRVTLGASVTFDDLELHSQVSSSKLLGAIGDSISYPPPQVKHAATVGGCVAASCPFLDLPIALLALDASATVQGRFFKRKIPFEELFVSLFGSSLKPGEFIIDVHFPQPSTPTASAFQKLETNANDLAILNTAVRLSLEGGRCANPRVFVGGGVGEVPVRCREAEAIIDGQSLSAELIEEAGNVVRDSLEPLSDHRASADYRKAMAKVFIKRCLVDAGKRLGVEV